MSDQGTEAKSITETGPETFYRMLAQHHEHRRTRAELQFSATFDAAVAFSREVERAVNLGVDVKTYVDLAAVKLFKRMREIVDFES